MLRRDVQRKKRALDSSGYHYITEEDIYDYLLHYRWKSGKPATLKVMKDDIRQFTANDFFDYQQIKAMTAVTIEDISELF